MKLSKNITDFIRNAAKVAKIAGIESLAIEQNIVRGMDENKTVVICDNNVPELPFNGIGIGRIDTFVTRYSLIENRDDITTEAAIDSNNQQVIQLTFNTKNIKVEYRCADTTKIKAPKQIKDIMTSIFLLPEDTIETLVKAQTAMGDEKITIVSDKRGTCFELVDRTSNDVFSFVFAEQAKSLNEDDVEEFVHRYPAKTLIQLLKQNSNQTIEVSSKGILKLTINNLNIYVIPSI